MQTAFVKTSISIPAELFSFLKQKAEANGGTPISRLVAQAIRQQAQKEKTKRGGKK
jgi:metal-responsive CopG/Arc/MetJ family transcriptional regulator